MKKLLFLFHLLSFTLTVAWAWPSSPPSSSIAVERNGLWAFRQAVFEDPLYAFSDWNPNDADPCDWFGVSCSGDRDHVISLKLSNSSLKGFIARELGSLTFLQELMLSNNLFLGTIPKQLGMLKNLNMLELSGNHLTGPIPPEIGGLTSISKLYLQSNGLTGRLPSEFGNLTNLVELRVDRNKLEGHIPGSNYSHTSSTKVNISTSLRDAGLCLLKQLNVGDFSYNFFIGKVPACLHYLSGNSFQGNCFTDRNSAKQRTAKQCESYGSQTSAASGRAGSHPKHQNSKQPQWLLIMEIVTGAVFIIFLVTFVYAAVKRCRRKPSVTVPWKSSFKTRDQSVISIDGEMLKHVTRLSRQDLEIACEDFSNIIGSSSDSIVYKGTMIDGPEIAVISLCISEDHWSNRLELYFQTEVANLARLVHENTAKLFGYCKESDPFTRMLVFEYASNGTLYEHLHYGDGCHLSWSRRMKIALGIARGLRYMHTEMQPPFSLSVLHSSTVYLTEEFSPKLVDFESWKAVLSRLENSGYLTTGRVRRGFQDSFKKMHADVQENVFSFGILLLEIISGRPPFCKERGSLVEWATQYLEKSDMMCHLVDPELRYFNHDDLRAICNVVSLCIQLEPSKRPSMQILAGMLESGVDTSEAAALKESPLAWAELALSS